MAQQQTAQATNKELFERMPVPRALASLAIPTIISQLIILVYNLADTFFIGRTNDPLMVAGASLVLPLFNSCIPIASLFGVGGGSLISRLLGAGDEESAKKVSAFSFYMALIFSAVFAVTLLLFMDPILRLLGASSNTIDYARSYAFCVIVIGGVPTVLAMTMSNLLRSVGCAKQSGFGVSMGGILNIALDPLFMFVILPKGKEILGAGIATMLSNIVVFAYFFITIRRMRGHTVLTFRPGLGLPEKKSILSVFSVGIPSALAALLFDVSYILIDKLASGYGDVPLAAVGIVLKAERLPLNIGLGLCHGMMPIAAYNYSSGNYKRMKEVVSFTRLCGLIVAGISIVMYMLLAPQIMRLFIADTETVAIGTTFLRIRSLATPLMFLSFHMNFLFQATGLGDRALILALARWITFNYPVLFLMNYLLGMNGIVWGQAIGDIFTVTASYLIYYHFRKKILERPSGA